VFICFFNECYSHHKIYELQCNYQIMGGITKQPKKRILILNDVGIVGGGAEIRIRLLIEKFLKENLFEEIHLLEHLSSNSTHKNVKIHKAEATNVKDVVTNIIKENQITHMQIHNLAQLSSTPILAAKELGIPCIFFAHDYWGFCGQRTLFPPWGTSCEQASMIKCGVCIGPLAMIAIQKTKNLLNQCTVGISPSHFVKEVYEKNGVLKGRWECVEPWIDTHIFSKNINRKKENTSTSQIVFIGPLETHKGIELLIKALSIVKKEHSSFLLRVVGWGQEMENKSRKKVDALIKKLKLGENIHFVGRCTPQGVMEELKKADLAITCPLWPELFGQTWAQAVLCGTPVITTKVGSIPELAKNKTILVQPEKKALATAIITELRNSSPVLTIPNNTPMFTIDKPYQKMKKIYECISK
jgi:glycosyltransferase involved in cell wall biosynthesis